MGVILFFIASGFGLSYIYPKIENYDILPDLKASA